MVSNKNTTPPTSELTTGFAPGLWLTVSEVSALTGSHENSIREACAERDGKYRGGRYTFRKAGKPYEILLTSLPPAAQEKHAHKHLDSIRKAAPGQTPGTPPATAPAIATTPPVQYDFAVYEAIWEAYASKPAGIKSEAWRRVQLLDEYNELIAQEISAANAVAIVRQRNGEASKTTLWRWRDTVSGHPRQYWEALLAPRYVGRARQEIHPQAWAFFRHEYGQQSEPNAKVIYRETKKAAAANGWGALPSCKTFQRRWDSDVPDNEKILSRKGKTALKESLPHLIRSFSTLRIHELWESDGRVADTSCRWPDGTVSRPWIVAIRDVRTRMILAVKIFTSTNAELVIDAFSSAAQRTGTRPEGFHLDNGTEYSNNPFTGGQKSTVRFSVTKNQPVGVLTRAGVPVKWATPYHGATKAIESFWNVIAEYVDKHFAKAYTGRNPVERPEDWDPAHAVPIEIYAARLIEVISAWCKGELGEHRGEGMNGMSPLELYNHLTPSHEARPLPAEQLRAMRPLIFRRVLSDKRVFQLTLSGFGRVEYEPADNSEDVRRGYSYDILPDPADPRAPALIYDGARYMGEAAYKAHTPYLSETAGGEIAERRGGLMKKARAGIKANQQKASSITPQIAPCEGLPALQQPELIDVLKIPKEQPAEPVCIIQIMEDGSALNTITGEVTKRLAAPTMPIIAVNVEADELERKRIARQEAEFEQWKARMG
ncbi:MAG: transposase domain-containing protein [Sulfurimicrobium sp.]|nr:transposase domain-containing protein [Sulfurimicrobium sp.]MDZ7657358.1 transposase domain-containing protein [Sulfurimicrobium sp.]